MPEWIVGLNPWIAVAVAAALWAAGKVVDPATPAGKLVSTLKDLWAKLTGKPIDAPPTVEDQVKAYERLRAVLHRKGDCEACDLLRKHLWSRIGAEAEAEAHK